VRLCEGAVSEQKPFRLYKLLFGHPSTPTAVGQVFEARACITFSKGGVLEPRFTTAQPTAALKFRLKSCSVDMMGPLIASCWLEDTFREKKGAPRFNRELDGVYMRPLQASLPAIDSLLVIMEGGHPRAILLRLPIAENHPVSGPALSEVWNALPDGLGRLIR